MAELHSFIQHAMGWQDQHLHRFRIYGKHYVIAHDASPVFDDASWVILSSFRFRAGERFEYEYDFCDHWHHDIRLEQILLPNPLLKYPLCIAGAGRCPPESCGGPAGYRRLIEECYSWAAWYQMRRDLLLVAQRILDHYQGGPCPGDADIKFNSAWQRASELAAIAPSKFSRRSVNAALRKLMKEPQCNSASNS